MKLKKIVLPAFLLAALASMTSCLGGDSTQTQTMGLSTANCFNIAYDYNNSETNIIPVGANTSVKIDYSAGTASVEITGLQVSPTSASYAITIADQKFTFDSSNTMIISVPSYIDTERNVTINNFTLKYLDRTNGYYSLPVWTVTFTMDSRYDVRIVQKEVYYWGKSTVNVGGNVQTFTNPYYGIRFDPTNAVNGVIKSSLYLLDAQFSENMPTMNLQMKDIPTTVDLNRFSMNASTIDVSTADGVTQPEYAVTNLRGSGSFGIGKESVSIDFTVANRIQTNLLIGTEIATSTTTTPNQ